MYPYSLRNFSQRDLITLDNRRVHPAGAHLAREYAQMCHMQGMRLPLMCVPFNDDHAPLVQWSTIQQRHMHELLARGNI